jgi:hypothetical protein
MRGRGPWAGVWVTSWSGWECGDARLLAWCEAGVAGEAPKCGCGSGRDVAVRDCGQALGQEWRLCVRDLCGCVHVCGDVTCVTVCVHVCACECSDGVLVA